MNRKEKILAFISLSISCFLTILDGTIVNVSLPTMANYFNTDISGISWVTTIYLIAFSALLLNASKLADIYGRKKLFIIGLFVFGISSALCGMADSLNLLIVFRALQGIGAAILTPLAIPIGVSTFGKEKINKLTLIIGMIIAISAAAGPILGGILNEYFGYKAIFYVNLPFILIALILGVKYIKESYDPTISKNLDIIGAILIGYGLATITFVLTKGNDYGWNSNLIILLGISAIVSILAFCIYEKNNKNSMIEFNLFKKRTFTSSIILIAVAMFSFVPSTYLMNFYFRYQLGYGTIHAGLTIGIISLVSFLTAPLFNLLAHKTSHKLVSALSMIFFIAGNFTLTKFNNSNYMIIIYTAFILMGLGMGGITPLYQSSLFEIPEEKTGIASGILNTLRQLTMCLSIALIVTLSANYKTEAISNTTSRITDKITQNTVLDTEFKTKLIDRINLYHEKSTESFSKAELTNTLNREEEKILSTVPVQMKNIVKVKIDKNISETLKIFDSFNEIKNNESIKVYNKCYFVIGLITILGLFVVPFNSIKKNQMPSKEKENIAS
ncbi:drug resistance transporter, EmrB/QacA subfamily [Clostridium cavendishii DSM 21758]|uniref:Drug resistance transporter, EmrB/QacA subfamily n=1 Tax=Clostridium cavendishii DSM 21758 TaxID=1121302 RepID=A0A1M6AIQ5_9CLOT|nr:MFS transporter [Clostridium cavendishii]SHI36301.1 drug resistance transporter, EmrB/QacA subfamily [Clostridium cavendishii DSM 21758]